MDDPLGSYSGDFREIQAWIEEIVDRWRRWLAVVVAALLLSGCTDSGEPGGASPSGRVTPTGAQTIPTVAHDPPSRFDLTQAVEVPAARAQYGTLHETTLLWVEDDGTVRSDDLTDSGRSWVTPLPTGYTHVRLMAPFVVGNVVVVATGEDEEAADEGRIAPYTVNITGLDVNDGTVLWNIPQSIDRTFTIQPVEEGLNLAAFERDGEVIMTFHPLVDYPSMLLDPVGGNVRWSSPTDIIPVMPGWYAGTVPAISGRYTVAAYLGSMYSLDLETGQVSAEPLLERRNRHVDPADPSYIILHPEGVGSSRALLRFSTVDSTVEAFTPNPTDIRYNGEYRCQDTGEPVWVCFSASPPYSVVGLDVAAGEVLWTVRHHLSDGLVVFHGYVYGVLNGSDGYAVIDQSTGETVAPDTGLAGTPFQVNEYGAMGKVAKHGDPLYGQWVWAPASG